MSELRSGALLTTSLSIGVSGLLLLLGRWLEAAALTGSCVVVIISGLWLEHVLRQLAQPGRPRVNAAVFWHTLGRLAFLGAFATLLYVARKQVPFWPVALGITLAVFGWVWAGLQGR